MFPKSWRNYWLLIVSLLFYGWGAQKFLLVMLLSIIMNYCFAWQIDATDKELLRKTLLFLSIIFNLGILFYNKYMNFTTGLLNQYISDSIVITEIALPIGISFFTFQAMSYVIDVYRKDTPAQRNICYLGLYIAFFPQLVAGPIVRYTTVAEQIENRRITMEGFISGVSRFMGGFAQKILLSNSISVVADAAFLRCVEYGGNISVAFAWIGAIAYALQILFDFAGYSSMAIGLGRMFGFEFLENFNNPYMAKTITDFWRRWHISLSSFFRDYVYIPLGGSRVGRGKLIRNLFIVWALTGIWHGADFTFLFWGLWYFVLLCMEKMLGIPQKRLPAVWTGIYRLFTLICILVGWVFFRAESLRRAWRYCLAMFGCMGNVWWDNYALKYLSDYKLVFLICFLFCTPIFSNFRDWTEKKWHVGKAVSVVYDMVLVACVLLGFSCLVMGANNPFIYFNF